MFKQSCLPFTCVDLRSSLQSSCLSHVSPFTCVNLLTHKNRAKLRVPLTALLDEATTGGPAQSGAWLHDVKILMWVTLS
jgi:hypothetical protein